eukprot:scaffold166928_cov37-Attheya_sp.AAC.1
MAAFIQAFRCSPLIPDGPPERLFRRRFTASAISLSSGTSSGTSTGSTSIGMGSPGGSSFRYKAARSVVTFSRVLRA